MFERCQDVSWIVAETAEVVAVYRAPAPQPLPGGLADLPPVQAFAVVTGSNGRQQVFAALYVKELKQALIFAVRDPQQPEAPPDPLLQRVLTRFAAAGIHLDPVNLKYGAAMREVVVRDIPVLASPETAGKAAEQQAALAAELQRQAAALEEEPEVQEGATELSANCRAALDLAHKERLAQARSAVRRLEEQRRSDLVLERISRVFAGSPEGAAEDPAEVGSVAAWPDDREVAADDPEAAADDLAVAEQEVVELAAAARQAAVLLAAERAERERLAAEKSDLEQRAVRLAEAARQAAGKAQAEQAEVVRLQARHAEAESLVRRTAERANTFHQAEQAATRDKERLAREKAAAEGRAAQLAREVAAAAECAARDQAERDRLAGEKLLAEEEAGRLAATLHQVEARLEQERLIREQLEREKVEAEMRLGALMKIVCQAEERAAAGAAERERLGVERAAWERLTAEKADLERRAAELAETARKAVEQVRLERQARQRLAAEKLERESLLADKARLEQQAVQLERVARMAIDKAERERSERELLLAAKARAEEGLVALQRQAGAPAGTAASAPALAPGSPLRGGESNQGQQRRAPVPGAFFVVDLELTGLPCDPLREVLEVQQSISLSQLSLEGFPNQYTSAWIVGLRQGDEALVRVVFRLNDSRRILIYRPARQPPGTEGYALARQEATKFLRVAGLEMERIPLGKTPHERSRSLAGLPFFLPAADRAAG
jgi:hypothetical protein